MLTMIMFIIMTMMLLIDYCLMLLHHLLNMLIVNVIIKIRYLMIIQPLYIQIRHQLKRPHFTIKHHWHYFNVERCCCDHGIDSRGSSISCRQLEALWLNICMTTNRHFKLKQFKFS